MTDLQKIIMKKFDYTEEESKKEIEYARERVFEGDNPEEVLAEEFGLEPDYIFDLI